MTTGRINQVAAFGDCHERHKHSHTPKREREPDTATATAGFGKLKTAETRVGVGS